MVFSSAIFLLYFLPCFLAVYFLSPNRLKNGVALIGSLIFYAWGAPSFIFILLASIIIDFFLVKQLTNASATRAKRYLLSLSLALNIGLLAYFKYANFFVENINLLLQNLNWAGIEWTDVLLPIGISFFTFQKLSYALDIYYKKEEPLQYLGDYALYIILFPQLIAGPIVRFQEIAAQLVDRSAYLTVDYKINGFFRFTLGLAKKLFIANVLGEYVDANFDTELTNLGTLDAWLILLAYTFQIYFDFSGYSDMAIGIGWMLGFNIPENFNFPYLSQSITEFWRRWHISLSRWMRDYLYIPLGGNRKGLYRTYLNLTLVFLISGLWHGAAWTFVLWGLYHGLFLVLERLFLLRVYERLPKIFTTALCFFIVCLGWVVFRAADLGVAMNYYDLLFSNKTSTLHFSSEFFWMLGFATFFSLLGFTSNLESASNRFFQLNTLSMLGVKTFLTIVLFILSLSEILVGGFNPFIYFRF